MGAGGEDILLSPKARGLVPLSIECKSYRSVAVYNWYQQAKDNCPKKVEPVVVFKANHKKPLVAVDAEYFFANFPQKQCPKCGETKLISAFSNSRGRKDGKQVYYKPCKAADNKEWGDKNPEYYKKWRGDNKDKIKSSQLKRIYGISLEDYSVLLEEQENKCKVCGKHEVDHHQSLHVDHDHNTGEIRGLLCTNCNIGLGYFKDNLTSLSNAIQYLRNFSKGTRR